MRLLIIIGSLIGAGLAYTSDDCPTNLERNEYLKVFQDKCYQFYPYSFFHYDEAVETCRELNGLLAMPKTPKINTFLQQHLGNTFRVRRDAWIGLDDLEEESVFVWDDSTSLEWKNFGIYQGPGSAGELGQDCVTLDPSTGTWNDDPCTRHIASYARHPFICEYPLRITTPKPTTPSCSLIECDVDCGIRGYKTDANGCLLCECESESQ